MSFRKFLPLLFLPLAAMSAADELTDRLKESASEEIAKSETDALFKHAELSKRYVAALKVLEGRLTAEGNLDAIIRVREEIQSVTDSGEPAANDEKSVVELRGKYVAARELITKEADVARKAVVDTLAKLLREREAGLTKQGQVEEALELRKEGERMLLELSSGLSGDGVEFSEDPRVDSGTEMKELVPIEIPKDTPTVVANPFLIKGRWLESMSVPPMKQRISGKVEIGDSGEGKRPVIVIQKGSVWSGKETEISLSVGKVVATKSTFESLDFRGDLGGMFYFVNCHLHDCAFSKGGRRIGGEQATKFYFENCVVDGSFKKFWNIRHAGYRGQSSVFEKVDLPAIAFEGREPARYVNHPWVKFSDCRFVDCKVPSSFLAITRDCLFENCEFIDDPGFKAVKQPFEVVVHANKSCRWNISGAPEGVTFTRKPDTDWKGKQPPTAKLLKEMMGF